MRSAGVGKTTLRYAVTEINTDGHANLLNSSLVIDRAMTIDPGFIIAYYYINYKYEGFHDIEAIVGCLMSQLLLQIPSLWSALDLLYQRCESDRRKPLFEELINPLLNLEDRSKIIVVIDALDEISDVTRATMLRLLKQLSEADISLFLTSRPIDLKDLRSRARILEVSAQERDLETYARSKLRTNENVQDVVGDLADAIIDQIVNPMVSHAAGMYDSYLGILHPNANSH